MPADVEAFIKKAQSELGKGLRRRSVAGILGRLETTSVERTKLTDVWTLDNELGQEGNILGMYWSACKFAHEIIREDAVQNRPEPPLGETGNNLN